METEERGGSENSDREKLQKMMSANERAHESAAQELQRNEQGVGNAKVEMADIIFFCFLDV